MNPPNTLIQFLTAGQGYAYNWGFPPERQLANPSALRNELMFLKDPDGSACLVRWYFQILMAIDFARREIAGDPENYDPNNVMMRVAESASFAFLKDLNGFLSISDRVDSSITDSLSGFLNITGNSTALLELGTRSDPMVVAGRSSETTSYTWPEWLGFRGGIPTASVVPGAVYTVSFRPRGFDCSSMLLRIKDQYNRDLHSVGLLDSFLSVTTPWDKLAVAWLAAYRNEA